MNFNRSSNWNFNNRGRRGRGGRGPGRGFDRGHRGGPWGRNNYRGPPQYENKPYWGDWNQDYSGPANRHMNQQWQNRPKRDTPGERLSEEDIGVTEFVSDHEGFNGVIKSRYSDFQVSEINDDGQVAKLTDENPPTPLDETVDEDEDLLLTKYNLEILPMDTWDSINKLVVSKGEPTDKVEIDVTGMTKEQRTKIHDAVKKAFGDSIVGSTVNENDKKIVRFVRYRKGVRIDNRVKWTWPGEYVYFIVHKENCDTMDAAASIVEKLRINMKSSMFGYAGTKDRRAKTSQWFSVRRMDPRKLHAATAAAPRIRAGNYSFHSRPLKLGMLQGNKFRIALRNVTVDEDCVNAACELLRTRGFLNYYGLIANAGRILFSLVLTFILSLLLSPYQSNYCARAASSTTTDYMLMRGESPLRNVTVDEDCVNAACELLRTRGFLNYYGLQRFGTRRHSPTYTAGLLLLRGDLKQKISITSTILNTLDTLRALKMYPNPEVLELRLSTSWFTATRGPLKSQDAVELREKMRKKYL
ncbi:hypothetical protein evm_008045 [Chilo suppressalis]|nr:hypothetical protein evm_008045 [Chilo suppressalis]